MPDHLQRDWMESSLWVRLVLVIITCSGLFRTADWPADRGSAAYRPFGETSWWKVRLLRTATGSSSILLGLHSQRCVFSAVSFVASSTVLVLLWRSSSHHAYLSPIAQFPSIFHISVHRHHCPICNHEYSGNVSSTIRSGPGPNRRILPPDCKYDLPRRIRGTHCARSPTVQVTQKPTM
jgi:hypothetical protein